MVQKIIITVLSVAIKNIFFQTIKENLGQYYAPAFFVKNVMEKVERSVRMKREWLILPIVVFVPH
jgi:hypothetical protein